jgi:anti-sigma28 factor (negative regulator of flagellin synthesis)
MMSQGPEGQPSTTGRNMRIALIKESIERDEYTVDPQAVASAILALLVRRQNPCS